MRRSCCTRASSFAKATCSNGGTARPNGGTGLGQRTKASDPHLWLPYVLARYVRQSGDASVLDVTTPYLEGQAVPENEETWIVVPHRLAGYGDRL